MSCRHKWDLAKHGCRENPGIFSDFCGGIVVLEECAKCGREKRTHRPLRAEPTVSYRNLGGEWGPEMKVS